MRRSLRFLHMCCGLVAALYAILLGVSGAILAFEQDLLRISRPEFLRTPPRGISTDPDQIMGTVRQAFPGWRPLSLTWPRESAPYWMTYLQGEREARQVYLDTASGVILGSVDPSAGWVGWVKRAHANLLAGSAGRKANGYGAMLILALSGSGIILWRPLGSWPIRFSGLRNLHYSAGIISVGFLLVFAVTGMYFVWPRTFVGAVHTILGSAPEAKLAPQPSDAQRLPLNQLAAKAEAAFPGRLIFRMQMVDRANQPVRVTFLDGSPEQFHRVSTLLLDPVTGDVVRMQRLADRHISDSIISWMSAVHFGVFGGLTVQLFWMLLGLGLPVLAVSGFFIWIRRMRAKAPSVESMCRS